MKVHYCGSDLDKTIRGKKSDNLVWRLDINEFKEFDKSNQCKTCRKLLGLDEKEIITISGATSEELNGTFEITEIGEEMKEKFEPKNGEIIEVSGNSNFNPYWTEEFIGMRGASFVATANSNLCDDDEQFTEYDYARPVQQFKCGDVVVNYYKNNKSYICRIKHLIKNNHASGFSRISPRNEFEWFVSNAINLSVAEHATPDQITQLEQAELFHGKKYNAEKEDYADFLTYDGLTLKKLLEHDLSEIEFLYKGDWSITWNQDKGFLKNILLLSGRIKEYRLKPKAEYVPFSNHNQLKPHRDRWIRFISNGKSSFQRISSFSHEHVWVGSATCGLTFKKALDVLEFEDGSPFGIKNEV